MIVCNLDIVGASSHPCETDAPLVVDSDAVLPRSITFQFLQTIAGRGQQVLQVGGTVEHRELPFRYIAYTGELSNDLSGKQALCLLIPETSDHGS